MPLVKCINCVHKTDPYPIGVLTVADMIYFRYCSCEILRENRLINASRSCEYCEMTIGEE